MATVKRTTRETPDQAFEHFDIYGFTDTRPSENRITFSDGLIHSIRDGRAQND